MLVIPGSSCNVARTESGNQHEQMNLRLDRIESLLSQLRTGDDGPYRGTTSQSHEKIAQTKNFPGEL